MSRLDEYQSEDLVRFSGDDGDAGVSACLFKGDVEEDKEETGVLENRTRLADEVSLEEDARSQDAEDSCTCTALFKNSGDRADNRLGSTTGSLGRFLLLLKSLNTFLKSRNASLSSSYFLGNVIQLVGIRRICSNNIVQLRFEILVIFFENFILGL